MALSVLLVSLFVTSQMLLANGQSSGCSDVMGYCKDWSKQGYCENPRCFLYMQKNCRKSCGYCGDRTTRNPNDEPCADIIEDCNQLAQLDACFPSHPAYLDMRRNCQRTCSFCKPKEEFTVTTSRTTTTTEPTTTTAPTTTTTTTTTRPAPTTTPGKHCIDETELCRYWSDIGECDKNPDFMLNHCKRSCKACGKNDNICQDTHRHDNYCRRKLEEGCCNEPLVYTRCKKTCRYCFF